MRLIRCIALGLVASLTFFAASGDAVEATISARDILKEVQLDTEEQTFYVCPPPTGSTLVRIEPSRHCPDHVEAKDWKEGIGVLYKENIAPYTFKAVVYYKNIVQTTTWTGATYKQITNRFTDRTPVSIEEIVEFIDGKGTCKSKAKYLRNNVFVEAFDRDDYEMEVPLVASKYSTDESPAWHTTNDTYTVFGSTWISRSGTSVNCIVEQLSARSPYPYEYFALSNGVIIESSPFFGYSPAEATKEPFGYAAERFKQADGYRYFDPVTGRQSENRHLRNWITTQEYTVAWNWEPKRQRVCSMQVWKVVTELLSAKYGNSRMRFSARELSASFISNATEFNPDTVILGQCMRTEAAALIDKTFDSKYNDTHVKSGPIRYYLLLGGFVLAYQPLISRTLAGMYIKELLADNRTDLALDLLSRQKDAENATPGPPPPKPGNGTLSRLRREVSAPGLTEDTIIKSTSSAQFASLQFVYDNIQKHINEMFSRIATAWCELQNRESVLWEEAAKINPSVVASANLGRRVGAKILGDVLAVSSCFSVSGKDVALQNSMRSTLSPNTCYSRPLVYFSYGTRTDDVEQRIEGQLGEKNELIPTTTLVEPCSANQKRYFLFGDQYVLFEDYTFKGQVSMSEISLFSTFVDLNLTLLEDREILPLTVYTKEEIRDAGVLDYAEVARRNQLHDLKFYNIDKIIEVDTNYAFMAGLAELFNGLGTIGKAVGKVVVGAAGALVSTVSGIASFVSNPFGYLAVGLLVVAGIVAAFIAYRYVTRLRSDPMKTLYPITTKELKREGKSGDKATSSDEEDDPEVTEEKLAQAKEMVKFLALLSAAERQEKKRAKKKQSTAAQLSRRLDNLRLAAARRRNGGRGYDRLEDDEVDELTTYTENNV